VQLVLGTPAAVSLIVIDFLSLALEGVSFEGEKNPAAGSVRFLLRNVFALPPAFFFEDHSIDVPAGSESS